MRSIKPNIIKCGCLWKHGNKVHELQIKSHMTDYKRNPEVLIMYE